MLGGPVRIRNLLWYDVEFRHFVANEFHKVLGRSAGGSEYDVAFRVLEDTLQLGDNQIVLPTIFFARTYDEDERK